MSDFRRVVALTGSTRGLSNVLLNDRASVKIKSGLLLYFKVNE